MIELVALCAGFFLAKGTIQISFHQTKLSVVNMANFVFKITDTWP